MACLLFIGHLYDPVRFLLCQIWTSMADFPVMVLPHCLVSSSLAVQPTTLRLNRRYQSQMTYLN